MENIVTLKLIDRQKRIINKIITYFGLLPAGLFFFSCFYVGRRSLSKETIFEKMFDFESYWRIVGPIGLIFIFILFIFLDKLIPYKRGQIRLTTDKIVIDQGRKTEEFETNKLKGFEFKTDIPFDTDDRLEFQKVSILRFEANNHKFDFEISVETASNLDALTPIIKSWKEENKEFKYGYK